MVAKTNIIVYKVLRHSEDGIETPFQSTPVKFTLNAVCFEKSNDEKVLIPDNSYFANNQISIGWHSYCSGNIDSFRFLGINEKTHYAVIPKGTRFFIGTRGDIVSDKLVIFNKNRHFKAWKIFNKATSIDEYLKDYLSKDEKDMIVHATYVQYISCYHYENFLDKKVDEFIDASNKMLNVQRYYENMCPEVPEDLMNEAKSRVLTYLLSHIAEFKDPHNGLEDKIQEQLINGLEDKIQEQIFKRLFEMCGNKDTIPIFTFSPLSDDKEDNDKKE